MESTSPTNRRQPGAEARNDDLDLERPELGHPELEYSELEYSELHRLLLEHRSLEDVAYGLAQWASDSLAEHAVACGIAVQRRRRPVLVAASDKSTERVMHSWLARESSPLRSVLTESVSVIGPDHAGDPGHATSNVASTSSAETHKLASDQLLMALPVPLEDEAQAALVLLGAEAEPDSHALLGAVGRCRRGVSWALRLAARYAHQQELAEHRAAAMKNRTVIDIAIGVVMGQNRCSPEDAFEILKRASNARNEKLADVARGVVASVTNSDVETKFEA
ncbi:ANTAR domain-containing protein [Sinomonas terrae]|uniref:ANTAR domain-containing protein n=1 Tax=Sinomonas terrae TaxID=2908838 RepID=A0ABS9U596_9MICC|nr:ANTAR domain-containing protein [Sinomonas terrae]MCH6471692.1 ANTAR domain-containing protein [Sinomonas terrae]